MSEQGAHSNMQAPWPAQHLQQQNPQQHHWQPAPGGRLGPDGKKVIETLPPLPETAAHLEISPATGQPRRHPVMLVGAGLLYASALVTVVAFALFWWQAITMNDFHGSARLLGWTTPRPGSWQSIVWVCVLALAAVAVAAAPAVAAFNAWNGHRWSRVAGLVAVAVTLLAILGNTAALFAIPLAALGAAVLWLPPVAGYFDRWAAFRADDVPQPRLVDEVRYGPLDRYLETR